MLHKFLKFFILVASFSSCAFGESLEEMVSNLIIEKIGPEITEVDLSFDNKSKSQIPNIREIGVKAVRMSYFEPQYSSFRVNVTTKNDQIYDIFGRYKAYLDVPVMSKGIMVGAIITEADLISVKTPFSKVRSGYVTSLGEIVGMQARRRLAGGALIRKSDILKPQVVRQGDNVSIIYDKGNIKLRTNGIAQGAGAIGDNIKIKNESTGTMVHGVIKGKNLVEVGV